MLRAVKAGVLYFAVVFAAGFALGTIRTLWVVPSFGARSAELIETPLMLVVSLVAARWVARRSLSTATRLGIGIVALILMLAVEFTFVPSIRGLTVYRYFVTRDPVSETVYFAALALFAGMPLLAGRKTPTIAA